jgi:hypothetical protein
MRKKEMTDKELIRKELGKKAIQEFEDLVENWKRRCNKHNLDTDFIYHVSVYHKNDGELLNSIYGYV